MAARIEVYLPPPVARNCLGRDETNIEEQNEENIICNLSIHHAGDQRRDVGDVVADTSRCIKTYNVPRVGDSKAEMRRPIEFEQLCRPLWI